MKRLAISLVGLWFLILTIHAPTLFAEKGRGGRPAAHAPRAHAGTKARAPENRHPQAPQDQSRKMPAKQNPAFHKDMPPGEGHQSHLRPEHAQEHFEGARKHHREALEHARDRQAEARGRLTERKHNQFERLEEKRAEHRERAIEHRAQMKERIREKHGEFKEGLPEPRPLPPIPSDPNTAPQTAVTGVLSPPAAEPLQNHPALEELKSMHDRNPERFREFLKNHPRARDFWHREHQRKMEFAEHKGEMREAAFEKQALMREERFERKHERLEEMRDHRDRARDNAIEPASPAGGRRREENERAGEKAFEHRARIQEGEPGFRGRDAFHKREPARGLEGGKSKMNMSDRTGHSPKPRAQAAPHKAPNPTPGSQHQGDAVRKGKK